MPEITIYAVRPDGSVDPVWSAPDPHPRLAFHIWSSLSDEYGFRRCYGTDMFRPLWRGIGQVRDADRWVLAVTFDGCVVERAHVPTLIDHLAAFELCHPHDGLAHLIIALGRLHPDNVQAVCFALDSNQERWTNYNVLTDLGHWYLRPSLIALLNKEIAHA